MSTKEVSAAIVTIKAPGAMTDKGRREIAKWLRNQASNLTRYGARYVDKGAFRARWLYEERT